MGSKSANIAAVFLVLLVLVNVVGVAIPIWYHKEHQHTANVTNPQCVVHVNIREGLWQRYCVESRVEDCTQDVQEWCDNLGFPEYNNFVIGVEICGDLLLIFALGTIIKSKCKNAKLNMEMVGAEAGLAGLLMMTGVLVYAATDSGEIGYQATDLHVGWAMCVSAGASAIVLCIYCMYKHINTRQTVLPEYFLIDDDDDDALLIPDPELSD